MGRMKGRVRLKSLKGKRWQKGQSSSSNPQTNKHRSAARGKFSCHLAQTHEPAGVALTKDALASHDAIQGDHDDIQLNSELLSDVAAEDSNEVEDTPSISMTTTSTAYSLIEMSHSIFNPVKKLWNSNVDGHMEICAVLAATSEVIKAGGGKESPTEYFGVLVTALESAENEKACMAIAYLLSLVIPRTPVQVLQVKYGSLCKILSHKLSVYEMSDLTPLLKYLVKCLAVLLGAQVGSIWSGSNAQRVFQLLLNYTVHPKPKLRKAAIRGVVSMLREGTPDGGFHPGARLTAAHCTHLLERSSGNETAILHTLGMLRDCLANINTPHLKSLCELILKFVSVGSSVVRTTALKVLHGLFSSVAGPQGLTRPDSATLISYLYRFQPNLLDAQLLTAWLTVMDAAHHRLPQDSCLELLPRLFTCAVDCLLADKVFVRKTAAAVMQGLLKKLGNWGILEEAEKSTKYAPGPPTFPELIDFPLLGRKVNLLHEVGTKYKAFGTLLLEDSSGSKMSAIEHDLGKNVEDINHKVFQDWLKGSGRKPVSWDTLSGVLQDTDLESLAKAVRAVKCERGTGGATETGEMAKIEMMFLTVQSGLSYKHLSSWKWVLRLLTTFYQVAGRSVACQKFMTKSLVSLSELRSTADFPYCCELDTAFGAAIKAMGPRVVLNAVPLMLDQNVQPVSPQDQFSRSWILPVLESHIEATELSYFRDAMMPLANVLGAKGSQFLREGNGLQAKLHSTLQLQVWSLLPKFCLDPVDLGVALTPTFARVLGMTLKEGAGSHFRKIVCQALKNLVSTCRGGRDADMAILARFSKNFLPILFGLYATPPSSDEATPLTKEGNSGESGEEKGYLVECIRAYLSITSAELREVQFSKLLEKLRDPLLSPVWCLLLDLAMAFAPLLCEGSLASLFNLVSPLLDSNSSNLQKKAYGCLEAILSGTDDDHQRFFEERFSHLRNLLVESLSTVSAGSKRSRLKCLLCVCGQLSPPHSEFIAQVVPEVILCMKEQNEKARILAVRLITGLGYAAQRCFGQKPADSVLSYFTLVLAGLAGSPHMVSCTLLALSKLVYEFHDMLGTDLIQQLVSSVLVFLSSQRREVVRSTLVLLKVVIGILPASDLAPHVESMVKSILSWGENKRNHFRLKCRVILERLVRKLDLEMVASFVPKKHQKLMLHIRKTNERQKRLKKAHGDKSVSKEGKGTGSRRGGQPTPSYEQLLESSDDEAEPQSRPKAANRNQKPAAKMSRTWIKEGAEDDPVNFMDPVVVKSILATNPSTMRGKERRKSAKANPFEMSEGKLVIPEEGEAAGESCAAASRNTQSDEDEEEMDVDNKASRRRKRRRLDADDEDAGDCSAGSDHANRTSAGAGGGIYRADAGKLDFRRYGAEYKAKKAKGDVKKKGQPEPYAYIPLNRQKLNRRKRHKLSGELSGIMKKAAKGSTAGIKKHRHKSRQ